MSISVIEIDKACSTMRRLVDSRLTVNRLSIFDIVEPHPLKYLVFNFIEFSLFVYYLMIWTFLSELNAI